MVSIPPPNSPISTHAPLARCDPVLLWQLSLEFISTHAPLARCDHTCRRAQTPHGDFNSRTSCEVRQPRTVERERDLLFQLTHLLRGATSACHMCYDSTRFQLTHLLRGATHACVGAGTASGHFNSRTSCEVRPIRARARNSGINFNSRTSCEVRHGWQYDHPLSDVISTHAPLARCDGP